MLARSLLRWPVLVACLVLLVGHVCVLPMHGHAEAASLAPGAHPADSAPDHVDPDGATCEALKAAPDHAGLSAPAVTAQTVRWAQPGMRVDARPPASPTRTIDGRPPLFVLHAALLI